MTITGLALADIKIYKNGGVTQRSSTAGFTLLDTDGIDFDGITGIHGISIDTFDNTDAGFYAAGNDYWVVIDSVTLDAATVSFVAATFSIDNRGLLRPTTAQRTLNVAADGDIGGNVDGSVGSVVGAVGSVTGHTPQTGDNYARLGAPSGASVSADNAAIKAETALIAADTNELQGNQGNWLTATGFATSAALATAQTDLDTITGADGVTLGTAQGNYAPLKGGAVMTESYADDGAAATPEQILYMIWTVVSEFAISGTTITTKKLDNSTTAMTFTLDDGTNPTSRTRAT